MPYYFSLDQVHREIKDIERTINDHFSTGNVECFFHTDPCIPEGCPICLMQNCPVRKHVFEEKILWSRNTVLTDKQHTKSFESVA
jgi:hypothetical protein